MKVKTIRVHSNEHPPQYRKNLGRQYDVDEREGRRLIAAGLVEEIKASPAAKPKADEG